MTIKRFWLLVQAVILRVLMRIAMILHGYPFPLPPRPAFTRTLPARPGCRQHVKLLFYTPRDYAARPHAHKSFPVVVNFHGGGFCLGRASDDARWARTVVDTAGAVVVSVDYRLAPEWPFPAAVDDGVDALLYLQSHADELRLDVSRVALSGFSAGGNLAFTVPLRLHSLLVQTISENAGTTLDTHATHDSKSPLVAAVPSHHADPDWPRSRLPPPATPPLRIVSITSWYPVLDFVLARDIRRKRSVAPSKTLPPFLTSLFDNSYLPNLGDRTSPFASPLRADDELLAAALPPDIFIYICEWDMLEHEARDFVRRLEQCGCRPRRDADDGEAAEEDGGPKRARSMLIEQSPHAWDKSANPFRDQARVDVIYAAAAEVLGAIFQRTAREE